MGWYLPEKQALFVHIPRTGGNWVRRALRNSDIPFQEDKRWIRRTGKRTEYVTPRFHTLPLQYLPKRPPKINFYWTNIRHPIAYYEASWKSFMVGYRKRQKRCDIVRRWHQHKWRWHPLLKTVLATEGNDLMDFNVWVEKLLNEHGNWITRYFEQVVGPEGAEWCQFIARLETLVPDFKRIMTILGYGDKLDVDDIGVVNKNREYDFFWDPSLKERVEYEERFIIRRFYGPETKDRRLYGWLHLVKNYGAQKELQEPIPGGIVLENEI